MINTNKINKEYFEKYADFEEKVENISSFEELENNIFDLVDDAVELNNIKYNNIPK